MRNGFFAKTFATLTFWRFGGKFLTQKYGNLQRRFRIKRNVIFFGSGMYLFILLMLFSGCYLFRPKNKCGDCPGWGKGGHSYKKGDKELRAGSDRKQDLVAFQYGYRQLKNVVKLL